MNKENFVFPAIFLVLAIVGSIGMYMWQTNYYPTKKEVCEYMLEEVEYQVSTKEIMSCKAFIVNPFYTYWLPMWMSIGMFWFISIFLSIFTYIMMSRW